MSDNLPLDVIRAIKIIDNYLNKNGYTDIQINSYIGTVKLFKLNEPPKVITPIALDMMMIKNDTTLSTND